MRDLIDRQATIEALGERPRFSTGGGYEMGVKEQYDRDLLAIINMPSAQLEEIRETGISRYGVAAWLDNMGYTKLAYAVMDKDRFPSAQPERKRGKWVFYEDRAPVWDIAGEKTWARAYKCPECGFVHSVIEDFGQYAFCPNCGADKREVDDERPD